MRRTRSSTVDVSGMIPMSEGRRIWTAERHRMDMETFSSVGCGRIPLDEVQADNRVQIEGDQHLGQKVLEQMNIMV